MNINLISHFAGYMINQFYNTKKDFSLIIGYFDVISNTWCIFFLSFLKNVKDEEKKGEKHMPQCCNNKPTLINFISSEKVKAH